MTYFKRFVLAVLLFVGALSFAPRALAATDQLAALPSGANQSISAEVLANLRAQLLELLVILQSITFAPPSLEASSGGTIAGASVSSASPEALTFRLLAAQRSYAKATTVAEKKTRLADLRSIVQARKQALLALIETNPAAALAIALPSSLAKTFPLDVQALIETETTVEGTLQHIIEDYFDDEFFINRFSLITDKNERIALHFAQGEPTSPSGSRIRVHGMKLDDNLVLSSDLTNVEYLTDGTTTTTTSSSAAVLSNTLGEQKTLVLLVNFQDYTLQPFTVAAAHTAVFTGLDTTSVSAFYKEASYGQTWLTGNTYGWYTLPIASTSDMTVVTNYANQAAANAGVDLSLYNRFIYIFPPLRTSYVFWSGMSELGLFPSHSWINGTLNVHTISHELGHALGLHHSHALECGTAITGIVGSGCTNIDYGDGADTMGLRSGHFNASQKERLGWLNNGMQPPITSVTTSGSYTIYPYELNNTSAKALKILKSTDSTTGAQAYYYVEYRQPNGFDNILGGIYNLTAGALLHTGILSDSRSSFLLDMTPGSNPRAVECNSGCYPDFDDGALVVGQSYTDLSAGVTITTIATSTTATTVQVTFGAAPTCTRANSTLTITPSSQWGNAGQGLAYTLTLKNNDSSGCTSSTFGIAPTLPAGWSQSPSAPSLTLSPGASANQSVTVTSSASASGGSHAFSEKATNNSATSYTSTVSATYNVNAAVTDTTAPATAITSPLNGAFVSAGSVVTINASATDNVGVARVEFFIGGKRKCTDTASPYSCSWTVPKAPNKSYTIQTKAYDAAGNVGSSAFVTVKSQ